MRGLLCIAVLVAQGDVIFTQDVHVRGSQLDVVKIQELVQLQEVMNSQEVHLQEVVEVEVVETNVPVDVVSLARSTMHERMAAVGVTCQDDLKTLCSIDVGKCPGMQQAFHITGAKAAALHGFSGGRCPMKAYEACGIPTSGGQPSKDKFRCTDECRKMADTFPQCNIGPYVKEFCHVKWGRNLGGSHHHHGAMRTGSRYARCPMYRRAHQCIHDHYRTDLSPTCRSAVTSLLMFKAELQEVMNEDGEEHDAYFQSVMALRGMWHFVAMLLLLSICVCMCRKICRRRRRGAHAAITAASTEYARVAPNVIALVSAAAKEVKEVSAAVSTVSTHVKCPGCNVVLRVPTGGGPLFRCPCGQLQRAPGVSEASDVSAACGQAHALAVVRGEVLEAGEGLDAIHVVPMKVHDGEPVVGTPVAMKL